MGKFKTLLETQDVIILDGALGTKLEKEGYDVSGKLWSAKYLLENSQAIKNLHKVYLQAGADIVTTSSYQATVQGLEEVAGLSEEESLALIAKTVTLAKEARDEVWADLSDEEKAKRPYPLISGDVGPYAAYLADGSEYTGNYQLSKEDFKDFHRPRIKTLLAAGSDLLGIETIPNKDEAAALVELLADEFPDVEAYMSFTAQQADSISDGTDLTSLAAIFQESAQVLALGFNCTAPSLFTPLLKQLSQLTDKPLVAYPNSGEVYDGASQTWHKAPDNSHTLLENVLSWQPYGAKIVGGCCRTSPEDIAYLYQALR